MNPRSGFAFAAAFCLVVSCVVPAVGQSPTPVTLRLSLPESTSSLQAGAGGYFVPALRLEEHSAPRSAPPEAFKRCDCDASLVRLTFSTFGSDGRDLPAAPNPSVFKNAPIGSAAWAPRRLYEPLVDGFRAGQQGMGRVFTGKLLTGIPSGLLHVFHLGPPSSNP